MNYELNRRLNPHEGPSSSRDVKLVSWEAAKRWPTRTVKTTASTC